MAIKKEIIITADTDQAVNEFNKLDKSMQNVQDEAKQTDSQLQKVGDNGGAIAVLDSLTGGLATRVRDAAEASKLLNVNLRATRGALLATGIGAFVVVLGTIVAYWDDIVDLVQQTNEDLEKQLELNTSNAGILESEISLLDKQIGLLEKQGKGTESLQKQKKALVEQAIELNEQEIKILEQQLARLKATQQELNLWSKIKQQVTETFLGQEEAAKFRARTIADQTKAVLELEAAILKARGESVDLETVLFDANNAGGGEDEVERGKQIGGNTLEEQDAILASTEEFNNRLLEENQRFLDEQLLQDEIAAADKIQLDQKVADARRDIAESAFDTASNFVSLAASLAEESKDLQKAAIIADSALGVGKVVINTQSANAQALAKYPFPGGQALAAAEIAFNNISAGIGIGANLLATTKALQALGGGSARGQTNTQANTPAAPSFNLVEGTESNQIAESLNRDNAPVKAFVTSTDMSTSQSLDRNIVTNSSIG